MKGVSDYELWSILVGESSAEYFVNHDIKTLDSLADAEIRENVRNKKLVMKVRAITELCKRLSSKKINTGDLFESSKNVFDSYRMTLGLEREENFVVLLLDIKNRLIKDVHISKGCLTYTVVHPREVFVHAIRERAAGIILVHNHPSGDSTPSIDDSELTQRLKKVGDLLGIRVLDHVIICYDKYYSFVDNGFFDNK